MEDKKEKDFSKEMMAYALKNAMEFGKADASKVLTKLFQHGLGKGQIKEVMPSIKETVEKVNKFNQMDLKIEFLKYKEFSIEHEEKEKTLPELPNAKGKIVTRLAPEPSKYLHIGHALSFLLNYVYAERYKGKCKLRFEDCNPEKVSKEYIESIIEDLKYLGIKYEDVRYVSDDMEIMYDYAEKLLKSENVYMCLCERDKMQDLRHKGMECECRQFSKDINMARWKEFLAGEYKEGDAVLRLKGNMQSQNQVMRDPVLFRTIYKRHFRHGNKYKIWPMYDFYNPIEDSLMDVTHILRSNEFEQRVELQDLLKKLLKLKTQTIVQYGRFNVIDSTTKGREIRELVESKELIGWDDPRLVTIKALRRRGISKETYYVLVNQVGLSKHEVNLDFNMIAAENRKIIDPNADRYFFVKDPVELHIDKLPKGVEFVSLPLHPAKDKVRNVKIGKIFISKDDFETNKGKELRLLHLFNINLAKTKDGKSEFTSLANKDIHKVQWVSEHVKTKVLMPDAKWIEGIAENGIKGLKEGQLIQFERNFFARFDGFNKKDNAYEFWFSHK